MGPNGTAVKGLKQIFLSLKVRSGPTFNTWVETKNCGANPIKNKKYKWSKVEMKTCGANPEKKLKIQVVQNWNENLWRKSDKKNPSGPKLKWKLVAQIRQAAPVPPEAAQHDSSIFAISIHLSPSSSSSSFSSSWSSPWSSSSSSSSFWSSSWSSSSSPWSSAIANTAAQFFWEPRQASLGKG